MINAQELELYGQKNEYRIIGPVPSADEALKCLDKINSMNHPRRNGLKRLLRIEELCAARLVNPEIIDRWVYSDNVAVQLDSEYFALSHRDEGVSFALAERFRPFYALGKTTHYGDYVWQTLLGEFAQSYEDGPMSSGLDLTLVSAGEIRQHLVMKGVNRAQILSAPALFEAYVVVVL